MSIYSCRINSQPRTHVRSLLLLRRWFQVPSVSGNTIALPPLSHSTLIVLCPFCAVALWHGNLYLSLYFYIFISCLYWLVKAPFSAAALRLYNPSIVFFLSVHLFAISYIQKKEKTIQVQRRPLSATAPVRAALLSRCWQGWTSGWHHRSCCVSCSLRQQPRKSSKFKWGHSQIDSASDDLNQQPPRQR